MSETSNRVPLVRLFVEGTAIVLSILLALALDEWRQGRHDRRLEEEYLGRLLQDLSGNLSAIEVQRTAESSQIGNARLIYSLVSGGDWTGLDTATAVVAS